MIFGSSIDTQDMDCVYTLLAATTIRCALGASPEKKALAECRIGSVDHALGRHETCSRPCTPRRKPGAEPMAMKTYQASCHCGAVRYQADIDLAKSANKCNCSLCTKSRAWFAFVPGARVRNIPGEDHLADDRWIPPGKPEPFLHFQFCKNCGVRAFGWGDHPSFSGASFGGKFYAVPVTALDYVDPDELAGAPVNYIDGRHDKFNAAVADTRTL